MANLIGGYSMVDCSGLDLTKSTKQTITGIYNKIKAAYAAGKLVLLCNAGVSPMPVYIGVSSTSYVASAGPLVITFSSDDGATVVDNTPELGNTKKSSK